MSGKWISFIFIIIALKHEGNKRERLENLERELRDKPESLIVEELITHLDNPCEVKEVAPGSLNHTRHVYLDFAKKILLGLKNPFCRELLVKKIEQYEKFE